MVVVESSSRVPHKFNHLRFSLMVLEHNNRQFVICVCSIQIGRNSTHVSQMGFQEIEYLSHSVDILIDIL